MGEFSIDRFYSKEDYLAILQESELKVEYVDGQLVNMSGGTINHNRISRNLLYSIANLLKDRSNGCEVFGSDQKISIPTRNSYFFPDISAVCSPIEVDEHDKDSIINPAVIIEVSSKSTRQYDAGGKFNYYQSLSSLREFVLIEQTTVLLTVYRLTADKTWRIEQVSDGDQVLEINSLGIAIPVKDIYKNVAFPG